MDKSVILEDFQKRSFGSGIALRLVEPISPTEAKALPETMQKARRRPYARSMGVAYLAYFVVALLGLFLTHHKIPAGALLNWIPVVLYTALTILLYRLFCPTQPRLAVAATLCSLAGCTLDGLHVLHHNLAGLKPLMFFGPFCILLGMLILRSKFLPRWLGWPLIVAGLCWLTYLIPVSRCTPNKSSLPSDLWLSSS